MPTDPSTSAADHKCAGFPSCRWPGHQPADTAAPLVKVPHQLVSRVLALCSYVGDHGGGERRRCLVAESCPSCVANKIADELAEVAGMTYGT